MCFYASYCLQHFHILPSQFAEMSPEELAIIIATIQEIIEAEDKIINKE